MTHGITIPGIMVDIMDILTTAIITGAILTMEITGMDIITIMDTLTTAEIITIQIGIIVIMEDMHPVL